MKLIDMTGQRFGRLIVVRREGSKNKRTMWLCICDCGNEIITTAGNLRSGDTQSCGCYNKERTVESHRKHGLRHEKLYAVYRGMVDRCYNENNKQYKDYGGRGITVCPEWRGEHGVEKFIEWARNNGYREHLTVDRKDNDGNYEPSNCQWTTQKEQSNNTRRNHNLTYNGETHTLSQWAEIVGINKGTLYTRINKHHWDIEKALCHPVHRTRGTGRGQP